MASRLTDYVTPRDGAVSARYSAPRVSIAQLVEDYLDEKIDFHGDMEDFMQNRWDLVDFGVSKAHLKYIATRLIPELGIHSKSIDARLVRDHYDRGDDFFEAFLGPRMVYTSGFLKTVDDDLELAQDQKMDLVCQKLQLAPGKKMLDIGCGWGTLCQFAAEHYGVDATGVTLSQNQVDFGNARIKAAGLSDRARLLTVDYRDIQDTKFDAISCLEMSEHVGSKNYHIFVKKVMDLMADDALFLLQIVGPRRGMRSLNPSWGLFMATYIFPGADAARPLSWVSDQFEIGGLEVNTVENINYHYATTIKRWYDNWEKNADAIRGKYGERWYRLWAIFLTWASRVGWEGESNCFQIVAHKSLNSFDRSRFVGRSGLGLSAPAYGHLGERRLS